MAWWYKEPGHQPPRYWPSPTGSIQYPHINTLRPRQHGRHFPDNIFKYIFLNENACISITISLKFVPKGPINKIPSLVQIMAWRRPGDKPLSEPMMVCLLTHICVTRPQWVKLCKPCWTLLTLQVPRNSTNIVHDVIQSKYIQHWFHIGINCQVLRLCLLWFTNASVLHFIHYFRDYQAWFNHT